MGLIDFHTHILPKIDDGSGSSDESVKMLGEEIFQGVDRVVLTPHFYAEKDDSSYFDRRSGSFDRLMKVIAGTPAEDMEFRLGAEVCYFPDMREATVLDKLCMADPKKGGTTNIMLVEMPFTQWDASVVRDIQALIEKRKYRVIIAHVERYSRFQKDKSFWNDIFDLPVIAQFNAEAFCGGFFDRKRNLSLLDSMDHVILGSDCHNTKNRRPNMSEGRDKILQYRGRDTLVEIDSLADEIFGMPAI